MASPFERDVDRLIRKWRAILSIGPGWEIKVQVNPSLEDCEEEHRDAAAYVLVESGYHRVYMGVNQFHFRGPDGDDLEATIVHELCHIPINPLETVARGALGEALRDITTDLVESATETFAKALLKAHRTARAKGKRR